MFKLFIWLAAGALLVCAQAWCSESNELTLQLVATLNGDRSIACDLSVKNTTGSVLDISIPDTDPRFSITVIDQGGKDLNSAANQPIVKDRKQRLVSVRLQPGEARVFHGRVVLPGTGDPAARLPNGTYSVEARLVTVKYVNQQYDTKVFVSNAAQIVVGK
jgi:hypothetical protein